MRSRRAARWPSSAASVMPPEHAPSTLTSAVAVCVFAGTASAQALTPPPPSIFAPKKEKAETASRPAAPERTRAISPEVAAQLAASAPKYTPPPPAPEVKPAEPVAEVDAREIDKPRNNIIRLPKYVVQEPRPPVFTERAITTEKGIKDIAMRRYISDMDRALNRFRVPLFSGYSLLDPNSTEARALSQYADAERQQNIAETKDLASLVSKSDAAQGAYILRESQQTFMRAGDFGRPSANPGGLPQRATSR